MSNKLLPYHTIQDNYACTVLSRRLRVIAWYTAKLLNPLRSPPSTPHTCFVTFALQTDGHVIDMNGMERRRVLPTILTHLEAEEAVTQDWLYSISR